MHPRLMERVVWESSVVRELWYPDKDRDMNLMRNHVHIYIRRAFIFVLPAAAMPSYVGFGCDNRRATTHLKILSQA